MDATRRRVARVVCAGIAVIAIERDSCADARGARIRGRAGVIVGTLSPIARKRVVAPSRARVACPNATHETVRLIGHGNPREVASEVRRLAQPFTPSARSDRDRVEPSKDVASWVDFRERDCAVRCVAFAIPGGRKSAERLVVEGDAAEQAIAVFSRLELQVDARDGRKAASEIGPVESIGLSVAAVVAVRAIGVAELLEVVEKIRADLVRLTAKLAVLCKPGRTARAALDRIRPEAAPGASRIELSAEVSVAAHIRVVVGMTAQARRRIAEVVGARVVVVAVACRPAA